MHPALEVIDRLIKKRELASKAGGVYSYPYREGMMYECTDCGANCQDDDCGVIHEEGCSTKEYNELKHVNIAQLKLLRDLVTDSFEIRKMLCVQSCPHAYMDDGEAQDSTEFPCIDYLRDSAKDIQEKRLARLVAKRLEGESYIELVKRLQT